MGRFQAFGIRRANTPKKHPQDCSNKSNSLFGFPAITRPEIYFGEIANEYILVRTRSQELDYPRGDQNVYARYAGRGGVPITSWLRRLAFAARFGELKIILSDDITPESRILMNREIAPRIERIAPFFRYDRDPYLVINYAGRLVGCSTATPRPIGTRTPAVRGMGTTFATR
jgi:uncharacterized membrane protein (UPF0182 family)